MIKPVQANEKIQPAMAIYNMFAYEINDLESRIIAIETLIKDINKKLQEIEDKING